MLRGAAGCGRRLRPREARTRLANPDYLPNDLGRAALLERQRCRPVVRQKCGLSFRPREVAANGRRAQWWVETGPGGARRTSRHRLRPQLATDQSAHGTLAPDPRQRQARAHTTGRTAIHALACSCTPSASACDPKPWAGGHSRLAAAVAAGRIAALRASHAQLPYCRFCPGFSHKVPAFGQIDR